jgi:hypothetical protein
MGCMVYARSSGKAAAGEKALSWRPKIMSMFSRRCHGMGTRLEKSSKLETEDNEYGRMPLSWLYGIPLAVSIW